MGMTPGLFALVAQVVPLAAGAFLLRRGWRGTRADDHPVCRRCGFDLFGAPTDSKRCPECGVDLARPGAVRDGNRRRQPRLMTAGAVAILFSLVAAGSIGWKEYSGYDVNRLKPTWMLAREIDGSAPAARRGAIVELSRRFALGTLSTAQVEDVAARVLALQADTAKQWAPQFGDFIEGARDAQRLSDAQWQRYAAQAPQSTLTLRGKVSRADAVLPYWIHNPGRVGSRARLYVSYRTTRFQIGDTVVPEVGNTGGMQISAMNQGGNLGRRLALKPHLPRLADGRHVVRLTMEATISESWQDNLPPITTKTVTLTGPFLLLSEGQPSVQMRHDESVRAGVERSLSLTLVAQGSPGVLSATANVDGPPVGLGYRVIANANGVEYDFGTFARPARTGMHGFGLYSKRPLPEHLAAVDVILRPSVQAAADTLDTFEIWDGEVVLKNVPIHRPATRPAGADRK